MSILIIKPFTKACNIYDLSKDATLVITAPDLTSYWLNCWNNFNGLLCLFKPFTNGIHIDKIQPFVSDFYYQKMINTINSYGCLSKFFSETALYNYDFIPLNFTSEGMFFTSIYTLIYSRLFQVLLLCSIVYLMRSLSYVICNSGRSSFFAFIFGNRTKKKDAFINKTNVLGTYWFFSTYSNIIALCKWLDLYLYKLNYYNKLHNDILFNLYQNIKGLITKFKYTYTLSRIRTFNNNINLGLLHVYNVALLSRSQLNIVYASLTVVYVILGWLLDYISYIWLCRGEGLKYKNIKALSFWSKHFSYAVLYIIWLFLGIYSTNGIYLSIANHFKVKSLNFNVIIFTLGSIISFVSSNIWYNLGKTNGWFKVYTSLLRSVVEWTAFLGMVLSTYGSWTLYYEVSALSDVQNFFIWAVPSFIGGYGLIQLEVYRPRLSGYYYGLVYLVFWTSICFSTNSIVVGLFTVDNAVNGISYLIPSNFILALVYSVPLYRADMELSMAYHVLDLLLFVLLTGLTLVTGGTLWFIIGPS